MRSKVLILCAVLVWGARAAFAQTPDYPLPPQEQAFIDLYWKNHKPIEAAEKARAYLATHPDSFAAWTVLGWIRLKEEGDLPRAHYDFSHSRAILEHQYGGRWAKGTPWGLYRSTLVGLFLTSQHMEKYGEAVRIMNAYNGLFVPKRKADAVWSLMKLGRRAEAEALISQALAGDDADQQEIALNALGAFQSEADELDQGYETFLRLYELMNRPGREKSATYVGNLAESAKHLLRFEECERLNLEATKLFDPGSEKNPWQDLAELYIEEDRLPEAIDAVKRMQSWAYHSMPVIGLDNWNRRQTTVACLFYACGLTGEALRLTERVAFRPDRNGSNSAMAEQWRAASLLFYRQVLLDRCSQLKEEASWAKPLSWPRIEGERAAARLEAWLLGRRVGRAVMVHDGWLAGTLRFLGSRSIVSWPGGEFYLIDVVGPGVAKAEILRLLERTGLQADRERPFLYYLLGACQVQLHDPAAALVSLRKAKDELPPETALTRYMVAGLEARACGEDGDSAGKAKALAYLMERSPVTIRHLNLSVPAVITWAGGPAARKAASLLKGSPRLSPAATGYRVRVEETASGALQGGIEAPDGSVLSHLRVSSAGDPDDTAREFCRQFHLKAFAPRLDLSQEQINSLEGSTLASQDARQALKSLLGPAPGQTTEEGAQR